MATEPAAGAPPSNAATLVLAWLAVGLPLLWGIWQTIKKTVALFH